jgi:hypothetical protein
MNEPRVFRNSPFQLILLFVIFGVLVVGMLAAFGESEPYFLLPFGGFLALIFLILAYSMTVKTIISDTEISTQSLLGAKSLNWGEINRVSGRGYGIKLHNFDGNVTVAPSPQLPGYETVIDWIGTKRPDLFNPQEYSEMKKNWASSILPLFFVLLIFGGMSSLILINAQSTDAWIPLIFFCIVGAVILATTLSSPQSVSMDGKSLLLKYLFSQKTVLADEIRSIALSFQRTRNGKRYFILLTQASGKSIRVSGLSPSLPIAYLTLKNWHKKNSGNSLTNKPINVQI